MAEPRVHEPGTKANGAQKSGKNVGRADARIPPKRPERLWGTRPGRVGVWVVILGTVLGALVTILSGSTPGVLLCVFMITATVIAVFAVRPGAGYLLVPVPALAYVVAALAAGLIGNHGALSSRTLLAVNAVQWIASGFFAMVAATALAIVVALARWQRSRQQHRPASRGLAGRG